MLFDVLTEIWILNLRYTKDEVNQTRQIKGNLDFIKGRMGRESLGFAALVIRYYLLGLLTST